MQLKTTLPDAYGEGLMRSLGFRRFWFAFAISTLACIALPAGAIPIPINLIVTDDPGEGYNDPVLGTARLTAMQYAADLWGSFFEKTFPTQAIDVRVSMDPLPTGVVDLLGFSNSPRGVVPPERSLQTTVSHLEMLLERRFPTQIPSITMDSTEDFFLGTSGNPGGKYDFVTTALHEFGHLFGMITGLNPSGTYDRNSLGQEIPSYYDVFVVNAEHEQLINLSPAERIAAATSRGGLLWFGTQGIDANGGEGIPLQTTRVFDRTLTEIHLLEQNPGLLMDPLKDIDEVVHSLSPAERGIFADLGWTLAPLQVEVVSEPASALLVIGGIAGLIYSRRRRAEVDANEMLA
jgi:hypothetical protein